MSADNV